MATNANWTVIFDDKAIINQSLKNADGHSVGYVINDESFWNDSKWSNIWAIQYIDDNHDYNDSVEHRDETPHQTWAASGLGDFRDQFVSKWDAAHLAQLQSNWDNDNVDDETESDKITRLGARPTSYSSY
jgi:hypothetical protein